MDFDPDASLRLFFAVKLAEELHPPVVALQQRLAAGGARVKWVEPKNLHFTLRFLGEMPALMVRDLKGVGKHVAAQLHPWTVTLDKVGAFPKLSQPQTLYASAGEGADELSRLARKLSKALVEGALVGEHCKPFVPHCTVGRVRQERGPGGLVAALAAEAEFWAGPMPCTQFALLSSTLTESGPIYTEIASFAFPQRPDEPEQ